MQVPRTVPEGRGVLSGVRNAVAVASAKGGVGKSTVSTNLALSLAQTGVRVGLLDADIYGPSLPLLMGVQKQPELTPEGKILPIEKHGVALMSIGFIAGEDAPVVWRGPLLAQALQHFIGKVEWGDLDYLLIDLPPGTGDIPLTLSQVLPLSGAVIVTTPQAVALEDVERGIAMFERVEIDVLGLVENMSYFICPHCSERHAIFADGGGRAMAVKLGLNFLGAIPLNGAIGGGGDRGEPIVLAADHVDESRIFAEIAAEMEAQIHRIAAREYLEDQPDSGG